MTWHLTVLSIFVVVLGLVHVAHPGSRSNSRRFHIFIGSAGGGMTAAYVFLHLLPELSQGHELLGKRIYLVALLGFLVFHGMEKLSFHRSTMATPGAREKRIFKNRLFVALGYNALVLYALPDIVFESVTILCLTVTTMALHFLSVDHNLIARDREGFNRSGRFLLFGALVLGAVLHMVGRPSELVADITVAVLSGSALYLIFREQLPDHEESSYPLFLTGVAFYTGLVLTMEDLGRLG